MKVKIPGKIADLIPVFFLQILTTSSDSQGGKRSMLFLATIMEGWEWEQGRGEGAENI